MTGGVDMLEAQRLGASQEARAFSDIAVLCRTHRQLELIESCLRHDDIPCVVSGREDFWDSDLVRGTLAFFRSVQVPWDGPALESALRLVFQCPTDLVQKALAVCRPLSSLEEPGPAGRLPWLRPPGGMAGSGPLLAPAGSKRKALAAGGALDRAAGLLPGAGTAERGGCVPPYPGQPVERPDPGPGGGPGAGHPAKAGSPELSGL